MSMIPNAMTGAPPVMAQTPPDSGAGMGLRDLYQRAALIILRDGGIDQEEMAAITEHLQLLQQAMQAQQATGAGGGMEQAVRGKIAAANPQMNGPESPYGSSPDSEPKYPMGG